ncbi:MAG TPA: hypothetical protein PLA43_15560 [Bryobacteraceae bacterium]|nr:hypothetical protein [Bryobacteraceae bacterium]HOL70367.1 hypothetical protein [Bryobacteraceae bacterium]HOQ46579.1 hypothetical protein [Bryobacteraceae bacterium]HPQ16445.1 hypothetical protein [Bryobacteraceae bacterium]HPU73370.1 hypothetical protein [Bryobacteraceae bacterium]
MKPRARVLTNLICLVAVMFSQQICLAQADPWERVRLIEQNANVHVKLHSGKTVKGKMESWNTDGLSVRQGKSRVLAVAKSDVRQVVLPIGMSRGRRAAWGLAIGGGVGGGFGGAICAPMECNAKETAAAIGAFAVLVGGIAAGIAALFPQHKEIIYSARAATEPLEAGSALPVPVQVAETGTLWE